MEAKEVGEWLEVRGLLLRTWYNQGKWHVLLFNHPAARNAKVSIDDSEFEMALKTAMNLYDNQELK